MARTSSSLFILTLLSACEGPPGDPGAEGDPGPEGTAGSPDTPTQIEAKLQTLGKVAIDVETLDGFDAADFLTPAAADNLFLTPAEANVSYLSPVTADATYLSQTGAAATYVSQTSAASTYLTQANAASTYVTQTIASSTFLTLSDAAGTFVQLADLGYGLIYSGSIEIDGDAVRSECFSTGRIPDGTGNAGGASPLACILGEIRMFPTGFAPRGTLPADGRTLQIADHPALHSLLGTYFGGDGITTFALPKLNDKTIAGVSYVICTQGTSPPSP